MKAKVCTNGKRCALPADLRGRPQPLDQFLDRWGNEINTCLTCRAAKKASRLRTAAGQGRPRATPTTNTPPGPPPKFNSEAHRQMWQAWLRDLVRQVQRNSS